MRTGSAIAGATLLFGPQAAEPDLMLAMQFLLDDLHGAGRRVEALKFTPSTLRLRSGPHDLVLTLAGGPLPVAAMTGLLRPQTRGRPDFLRVHLARSLRLHQRSMGFMLYHRGPPSGDAAEAARRLVREAQLCLMPVIEALPPSLVIWQPGGLVLGTDEFRQTDSEQLLTPGDGTQPLHVAPPEHPAPCRPGNDPPPPAGVLYPGPVPASRAERARHHSLGHLFSLVLHERPHAVLASAERAQADLAAALRQDEAGAARGPSFPPLGAAQH